MTRTCLLFFAFVALPADPAPLVWDSCTPILVPDGAGGSRPAMVLRGPSRPLTDDEVAIISAWNAEALLGGGPFVYLGFPDDFTIPPGAIPPIPPVGGVKP